MAEGFSEAVAGQLVAHWEALPNLAHIAASDTGFRHFVLQHVNQTLDDKDLKTISANSVNHCPKGLNLLCRDLKRKAEAPSGARKIQANR
jgi:hypothetical protein